MTGRSLKARLAKCRGEKSPGLHGGRHLPAGWVMEGGWWLADIFHGSGADELGRTTQPKGPHQITGFGLRGLMSAAWVKKPGPAGLVISTDRPPPRFVRTRVEHGGYLDSADHLGNCGQNLTLRIAVVCIHDERRCGSVHANGKLAILKATGHNGRLRNVLEE